MKAIRGAQTFAHHSRFWSYLLSVSGKHLSTMSMYFSSVVRIVPPVAGSLYSGSTPFIKDCRRQRWTFYCYLQTKHYHTLIIVSYRWKACLITLMALQRVIGTKHHKPLLPFPVIIKAEHRLLIGHVCFLWWILGNDTNAQRNEQRNVCRDFPWKFPWWMIQCFLPPCSPYPLFKELSVRLFALYQLIMNMWEKGQRILLPVDRCKTPQLCLRPPWNLFRVMK